MLGGELVVVVHIHLQAQTKLLHIVKAGDLLRLGLGPGERRQEQGGEDGDDGDDDEQFDQGEGGSGMC